MISDDGTLESRCGTAATAPPGLSSHLAQSLLPTSIHEHLLCTLSQPQGTGMLRSPRRTHAQGALSLSGKWSYWLVAESRAVQDMRMTACNEEPPFCLPLPHRITRQRTSTEAPVQSSHIPDVQERPREVMRVIHSHTGSDRRH